MNSYWDKVYELHTHEFRNHQEECRWLNHNFDFCTICGEFYWVYSIFDHCTEEKTCWAHCTDIVHHNPEIKSYAKIFESQYSREETEEMHADRELMRDEFHI